MRVRYAIATLALCCLAAGAEKESGMAQSVARMQAAVEKQRASVRRQAGGDGGGTGFFTTPWLNAPAAVVSLAPRASGDCDALPESHIRKLVTEAAQKEGVNPMMISAIIKRESGGRPCAVSERGAQGLMQIMPATGSDLGLSDPFDPAANVHAGTRYVKQMLTKYKGNMRLALAAYNAGPQRVDEKGDVPAIPETQAYVAGIIADLGNPDEAPIQ